MPEQLRPYLIPLLALLGLGTWFLLRPAPSGPASSSSPDGPPETRGTAALLEPSVRPVAPHVEGPLTPAIVTREVAKHQGALEACYAEALRRDAGIGGRLMIALSVDDAGKVVSARTAASQVGDDEVAGCFADVLAEVPFPINPRGETSEVIFPFDLQSRVAASAEIGKPSSQP